jgi:hypothetical protein
LSSSSELGAENGFSAGSAPEKLYDLRGAFGLLSSIQQADECQIARIDKDLVVLPMDLDLSQYLGQSIGMIRETNRILIRRLEPCSDASPGRVDVFEIRQMVPNSSLRIHSPEAGQ